MKHLFLQLGDLHIDGNDNSNDLEKVFHLKEILNSLNEFPAKDIGGCSIILVGDIANKATTQDYRRAKRFLHSIIEGVKQKYQRRYINVFTVPGNHDIDLRDRDLTYARICEAYKNNSIQTIIDGEIDRMNNFWELANREKCFVNSKLVDSKSIMVGKKKLNFVLINSAPLSMKGGKKEDKGCHYVPDIASIEDQMIDDGFNFVVMHHDAEWFYKTESLERIFTQNAQIVISGHEHYGKSKQIAFDSEIGCLHVQSPALSGDVEHKQGYNVLMFDSNADTIDVYNFTWDLESEVYRSNTIIKSKKISHNVKAIKHDADFIESLKNPIGEKDYFVCPNMESEIFTGEKVHTSSFDSIGNLVQTIKDNKTIYLLGGRKMGKTTIAEKVYLHFAEEKEYYPVLLRGKELTKTRVDRLVQYEFNEEYLESEKKYELFLQLESSKRILIIDDYDYIRETHFKKIIEQYRDQFSHIVLLGKGEKSFNISEQLKDSLNEDCIVKVKIQPLLYSKRKALIKNVCQKEISPDTTDYNTVANEINNQLSTQVRLCALNPKFVIEFVKQSIENKIIFNRNQENIYSKVFEMGIVRKIDENIHKNSSADLMMRVLQDIAFEMHFSHNKYFDEGQIFNCIKKYNEDYRKHILGADFIADCKKSNIFTQSDKGICFTDQSEMAYFVARALNQRINKNLESIKGELDEVLKYLYTDINNDVILFLAMITQNTNVINTIYQKAEEHFAGLDEFSLFDNVTFINDIKQGIVSDAPNVNDKKRHEQFVDAGEKRKYCDDIVEVINEYDYNDEELKRAGTQALISLKYLEIIGRILPSFAYDFDRTEQDEAARAIYRYTNKFLYQVLQPMDDDFAEAVNELAKSINKNRAEHNLSQINEEQVAEIIKEISIALICGIYDSIANIAVNEDTISALNECEYDAGMINNAIFNLCFNTKTSNEKKIKDDAIKLKNLRSVKGKNSIVVEEMAKIVVYGYLMNNSEKVIGNLESLAETFFGKGKKKMKLASAENIEKNIKQLN